MPIFPVPLDNKTTGKFKWLTPFRGQGVLSVPSDPWDDDLYQIFEDIDTWLFSLESGSVLRLQEFVSPQAYGGAGPIIQIKNSFAIDLIDILIPTGGSITLKASEGDMTAYLPAGKTLTVTGSSLGNDGSYTVVTSSFGLATAVDVVETPVAVEGPGAVGVFMGGIPLFDIGHRTWAGGIAPAPCGYTGSGGGSGVTSLNLLTGNLTLAAGPGISIVPSGGNTLTINNLAGTNYVAKTGDTMTGTLLMTDAVGATPLLWMSSTNPAGGSPVIAVGNATTRECFYGQTIGSGNVGYFYINSAGNSEAVMYAKTIGTGSLFAGDHTGVSGYLLQLKSGGSDKFVVDKTGAISWSSTSNQIYLGAGNNLTFKDAGSGLTLTLSQLSGGVGSFDVHDLNKDTRVDDSEFTMLKYMYNRSNPSAAPFLGPPAFGTMDWFINIGQDSKGADIYGSQLDFNHTNLVDINDVLAMKSAYISTRNLRTLTGVPIRCIVKSLASSVAGGPINFTNGYIQTNTAYGAVSGTVNYIPGAPPKLQWNAGTPVDILYNAKDYRIGQLLVTINDKTAFNAGDFPIAVTVNNEIDTENGTNILYGTRGHDITHHSVDRQIVSRHLLDITTTTLWVNGTSRTLDLSGAAFDEMRGIWGAVAFIDNSPSPDTKLATSIPNGKSIVVTNDTGGDLAVSTPVQLHFYTGVKSPY